MLRKLLTFRNITTGFPAKWRLRNEQTNCILMTCHHSDLIGCCAAEWLKIWHFAGKPVMAWRNFGCFLRPLCGQGFITACIQSGFNKLELELAKSRLEYSVCKSVVQWLSVLRLAQKIETKSISKDTVYFHFRWRNRREAKKKKKANERTSQGR